MTGCGDCGSSAGQAGVLRWGVRGGANPPLEQRGPRGPEPARGGITRTHSEISHCFSGVKCGAPGISWRGKGPRGDQGGQQAADTGQSCSWPSLEGRFQTRVGPWRPEGALAVWQTPHRFASCWWLAGADRTAGTPARAWGATPRTALGAARCFSLFLKRSSCGIARGSESRRALQMFPEQGADGAEGLPCHRPLCRTRPAELEPVNLFLLDAQHGAALQKGGSRRLSLSRRRHTNDELRPRLRLSAGLTLGACGPGLPRG